MSEIQGPNSHSPQEIAQFKQELMEGTELFSKALNEYQQADAGPKKEKFKEVMQNTLPIMNQIIGELKNEQLQQKEAKLAHDFLSLGQNASPQALDQLKKDLNDLKGSI